MSAAETLAECCVCGGSPVSQTRHGYFWCSTCWGSTLPRMSPLEAALRAEVDQLCHEAMLVEDRIEQEVNYRLRETLLRLADRLKETA